MYVRVGWWRKLKNWCFWTVVLEKTLESPLDCKEIHPVHPKGDQSWVFIGGTDVEVETPILWPPDAKSWLIGKDPDAGRDWGQEEMVMTEDEMAGWHHRLDEHEVWVNSGSWWWTGRPGVLRFMGSQRVRHDWATELNWTELIKTNAMCWMKPYQRSFTKSLSTESIDSNRTALKRFLMVICFFTNFESWSNRKYKMSLKHLFSARK